MPVRRVCHREVAVVEKEAKPVVVHHQERVLQSLCQNIAIQGYLFRSFFSTVKDINPDHNSSNLNNNSHNTMQQN